VPELCKIDEWFFGVIRPIDIDCEKFHKLNLRPCYRVIILSAGNVTNPKVAMKLSRPITALAAIVASLQMVSAGDITGKIDVKGKPSKAEIPYPLDPGCGKLWAGKPAPTTRHWAISEKGGLADVFVYVKEGLGGKTFPVPEKKPVLDQVDCEYVPYMLGLQTGQTLLVRNSDPLLHNVHPIPAVAGNTEKNLAQLAKSKDLPFVFPKEEIFVKFKCDVHQWMFAWVGVVSHPFHAVTDKDGNFKITGLPAGEYTIEAVHRRGGKQTAKITVPETGGKDQNFTFEAN
jgi:hypothetical protein